MSQEFNFFVTCFILLFSFLYFFFILLFTISSRNPIIAIINLILFFFGISFLFIYFGADYLGVLVLLIYAGAVSILFLFVVMFLDMKDLLLERHSYFFYIILILTLFFLLLFVILISKINWAAYTFMPRVIYTNWFDLFYSKTNIEVIGLVFFEYYTFQFIVIGFVLFFIMVLIISLLINYNLIAKKQKLSNQINKRPAIKKS